MTKICHDCNDSVPDKTILCGCGIVFSCEFMMYGKKCSSKKGLGVQKLGVSIENSCNGIFYTFSLCAEHLQDINNEYKNHVKRKEEKKLRES